MTDNFSISSITPQQFDSLAVLHRQAFSNSMNARLGLGYAKKLIKWFAENPACIALAAVDSHGRPQGYALGMPTTLSKNLSRDLAPVAAVGIISHPQLLFDREFRAVLRSRLRLLCGLGGGQAKYPPPSLPEPTISLTGIGVSPSSQGQGLGSRLVEAFESRARTMGARSVRLSVRIDNAAAIRCYEKCGWSLCPTPAELPTVRYYSKLLFA